MIYADRISRQPRAPVEAMTFQRDFVLGGLIENRAGFNLALPGLVFLARDSFFFVVVL